MSKSTTAWLFTLLSITFLVILNLYLFNKVQALETRQSSSLSINDIVVLIDERNMQLEKRKSRERLFELEKYFQLASTHTPENRFIYGDTGARITLKEFADIECPFCRKMHDSLKQITDHSKGVINWEFKHFPLSMHNPVAANESLTIECVKDVYDNRTAWVVLNEFINKTKGNGKGVGDIDTFIRSIGLNDRRIKACTLIADKKIKINQDFADGQNAGVSATPAILIADNKTGNNFLLRGYKTPEQILSIIQNMIN